MLRPKESDLSLDHFADYFTLVFLERILHQSRKELSFASHQLLGKLSNDFIG